MRNDRNGIKCNRQLNIRDTCFLAARAVSLSMIVEASAIATRPSQRSLKPCEVPRKSVVTTTPLPCPRAYCDRAFCARDSIVSEPEILIWAASACPKLKRSAITHTPRIVKYILSSFCWRATNECRTRTRDPRLTSGSLIKTTVFIARRELCQTCPKSTIPQQTG